MSNTQNPPPFNADTFKEVVEANMNSFVQYMNREVRIKIVRTGNPLMSEAEISTMASRFFDQKMAEFLAANLKH